MGLIQSIDGVLLGAADVFQEADNIRGFQFARMALLMIEDKPLCPLGIPFAWFWAPEVVVCRLAQLPSSPAAVRVVVIEVLTSLNSWNKHVICSEVY